MKNHHQSVPLHRIKLRLKKGDLVRVIAGKHKGLEGPILKVNHRQRQVFLEGVQAVKHKKPSQQNEEGGIIKMNTPLAIAKVALLHPKNRKITTRVSFCYSTTHQKQRVTRKNKVVLP